jgi:hypothetical protein
MVHSTVADEEKMEYLRDAKQIGRIEISYK